MLDRIRYFQSVVKLGSFTDAAEEHFISQSAISQQIKALEEELGVKLLERSRRSIRPTPEGEYFYKKSLVLVAGYDAMCRELKRMAGGGEQVLRLGVLKGYSGPELSGAAAAFSAGCPDVDVRVTYGNHDALYDLLRVGELDLVINDQRRAFSEEYVNIVLDIREYYAAISENSPLAQLDEAELSDLESIPLILLSSEDQQETERRFYAFDLGFKSEIRFCGYLDDAHMLVVQGKGYLPIEGGSGPAPGIKALRLMRNGTPILRRYCAFMKKGEHPAFLDEFVEILKGQY